MGNACTICSARPKTALNGRLLSCDEPKEALELGKKQVISVTVLLLGPAECGKSTILKQMKIMNLNGFSNEERLSFIPTIRQNLMVVIMTVLKEMEELGISFSDELSEANASRFEELTEKAAEASDAQIEEMRDIFEVLMKDKGVQECIARDFEYYHLDSSNFFLERALDIMRMDYLPNNDDILRARRISTKMDMIHFTKSSPKVDLKMTLVDVGGQRSERKKWSLIFRSMDAVIFVTSTIEFDQVLEEDGVTNRFDETMKLFGQVTHHSSLKNTMMMSFLNKSDILEQKIKRVSFKNYFPDYRGDAENVNEVIEFIRMKLEKHGDGRLIYSHVTCATDKHNVKSVFKAVEDYIMTKSMVNVGLL